MVKFPGRFSVWHALFLALLLAVFVAPFFFGPESNTQNLGNQYQDPMWISGQADHVFGTDKIGRDMLYRVLKGGQISISLAIITAVISGTLGIALGMLGGYCRGGVDNAVNFLLSVRLTLPVVLVAMVMATVHGNSIVMLYLIVGLLLWDRFLVVARNLTMVEAAKEYVLSAQLSGLSRVRICFSEILPNIYKPLLPIALVEMAHAILLESALSFLGVGVQPPYVSWGQMIADAKDQIFFRPWSIYIPAVFLFITVYSINMMSRNSKKG